MTDVPRRNFWRDWGPAIMIMGSVLGGSVFIGGVLNEVKTNTSDIGDIKIEQRALDAKLSTISETVARTDGTLTALRDRKGQIQQ